MGTNFATVWQQAIRRLQDCCSNAGLVPDSQEVEAASRCVEPLYGLPPAPKAAWKRVLLQLKVPLQLGTALTTATQHGWKSPCVQAAVDLLKSLLTKASGAAGITKLGSLNDGSLSSAIREQLQQSGLLQALAAIMTAMAADLQAEAASLAAGGSLAAGIELGGRVHKLFESITWVHWQLSDLWGCHEEPPSVRTGGWLCDPSSHVLAVMQLTSAYMQYASAVVQHVLPNLQERAPQEGEQLLSRLSASFKHAMLRARMLQNCRVMLWAVGERSRAASCSSLLRSPAMLPYAVTLLIANAADVRKAVAAACHKPVSAGSSSKGTSSSSGSAQGDSSDSGAAAEAFTTCQLQLLELLGLAPQVIAWLAAPCSLADAGLRLFSPLALCSECDKGRLDVLVGLYSDAGLGVDQQEKQLLQFEHQLFQLLPLVLLPCARALLSPSAQGPCLGGPAFEARQIIATSSEYLHMGIDLSRPLLAEDLGLPVGPKQGTWVQEMLGELLQVAGLITLLPPAQSETAAATQRSAASSSSSNSGAWSSKLQAQADMLASVAGVLCAVVHASRGQGCDRSRESTDSPCGAAAAVAVPLVAQRFVEVYTAVETAQRVVLAAAQNGSGCVLHKTVLAAFRAVRRHNLHGVFGDNGVWHMGRCGPVAHAQELRQYYSALSTVLKLGCCAATPESDSARQLAGCCCVIAGHAALRLLPTALVADQQPQSPAGAAAVMVANQLAAEDYLPSMVLFGRCCLLWAELLRLEGPQLLLLAAGQQQEGPGWETVLHENSAALVCIPWPRQRIDGVPWDTLECLTGLLSKWVGGVESPLALDRLAAAGCAPQQLQQQLEALSAAQQGVQQGLLTEASLAALVRQLQVVGGMLTGIAVPHFCNNPACRNVSGPTDVRLVSGRSCMCAGCLTARYCGRDCQRAAWKQHKPVCKALAAAAAATDVAATAGGS